MSFNLGGARIALGPESSTECARSGRDKPHLSTRRPKAADSSVILPDSIFARSRMSVSSVSGAREREPPPTPRFSPTSTKRWAEGARLVVLGRHRLRLGPGREAAGRLGRRARHPEDQGGAPAALQLSGSGARGESWVYSRSYAHYLGGRYARLERDVEEKGWIAVPAPLLRWGQARAAARAGWSSDSYAWLAGRQPITVIGNSIFVYEIW